MGPSQSYNTYNGAPPIGSQQKPMSAGETSNSASPGPQMSNGVIETSNVRGFQPIGQFLSNNGVGPQFDQ